LFIPFKQIAGRAVSLWRVAFSDTGNLIHEKAISAGGDQESYYFRMMRSYIQSRYADTKATKMQSTETDYPLRGGHV